MLALLRWLTASMRASSSSHARISRSLTSVDCRRSLELRGVVAHTSVSGPASIRDGARKPPWKPVLRPTWATTSMPVGASPGPALVCGRRDTRDARGARSLLDGVFVALGRACFADIEGEGTAISVVEVSLDIPLPSDDALLPDVFASERQSPGGAVGGLPGGLGNCGCGRPGASRAGSCSPSDSRGRRFGLWLLLFLCRAASSVFASASRRSASFVLTTSSSRSPSSPSSSIVSVPAGVETTSRMRATKRVCANSVRAVSPMAQRCVLRAAGHCSVSVFDHTSGVPADEDELGAKRAKNAPELSADATTEVTTVCVREDGDGDGGTGEDGAAIGEGCRSVACDDPRSASDVLSGSEQLEAEIAMDGDGAVEDHDELPM